MSTLSDLEAAFVNLLGNAVVGPDPAFRTVRGLSGGYRPAVRDLIQRSRLPGAFVAFIDEPTAPETKPAVRGAHFVVLVADRVLRVESDPRNGDVSTPGAFALLDAARAVLDNAEPIAGLRLVNLHAKFVEADDRMAVYELLYRVWPIVAAKSAPAAPTDLQAFADPVLREVRLSWTPPAETPGDGPPDYYRIYRKLPSDADFLLQEAAADGETVKTLTNQPAGVTLQYRVTAANAGGEGPASNVVTVML